MKKRDIRLNTQAHRPAFDAFADALLSAGRREGWRSSETLRHFLEAGFRAVRGRMLRGEAWEQNEAEYMKIVGRCRQPQETMKDLSVMLGALTSAMLADPIDFIGPVFTELSADSGMGQFFTPFELSRLMAKMIFGEDRAAILDGKRFIRVQEPACGVGGMVLATNHVLREAGIDLGAEVYWHMADIDFRAVCACYLQCSLSGCAGVVTHGNTLSLEDWSHSVTPAAALNWKLFSQEPEQPRIEIQKPVQLSLFDEAG